jgi:hypothetical protein
VRAELPLRELVVREAKARPAAKRRVDRCNVIDVQRAAALEVAERKRRTLKARDVNETLAD